MNTRATRLSRNPPSSEKSVDKESRLTSRLAGICAGVAFLLATPVYRNFLSINHLNNQFQRKNKWWQDPPLALLRVLSLLTVAEIGQ
jgi:hypothetical protein